MKKIVRENSDSTLKDIERGYGTKVAKALAKYCDIKKLDVDDVVSDMREDGNGLTPWDKFDIWARRTQGLDIMSKFDDTIDWTDTEDDRKREREFANMNKDEKRKAAKKSKRMLKKKRNGHALNVYAEPKFDRFTESSGNDPQDVLDFIAEELYECEWVSNIDYDDVLPKCYVDTDDGKTFVVSVDKV